jgi:hypothetical protein
LALIFRHIVPPFIKGGQGGFAFKNQGQIPLNPPLLKGDFIVSGRSMLISKGSLIDLM